MLPDTVAVAASALRCTHIHMCCRDDALAHPPLPSHSLLPLPSMQGILSVRMFSMFVLVSGPQCDGLHEPVRQLAACVLLRGRCGHTHAAGVIALLDIQWAFWLLRLGQWVGSAACVCLVLMLIACVSMLQMAIFTTWITCPSLALLFRGRGDELREDGLPVAVAAAASPGGQGPDDALQGPPKKPAASAVSAVVSRPSALALSSIHPEIAAARADMQPAGDAAAAARMAAAGGMESGSYGGVGEVMSPRVRRSTGSITLLYSRDSSSGGCR
jgi:hypothetical protein